jgi:hypothetical protein
MVRSRALRGVSNHEVLGLSFETHRFALLLRVRLKKATNEMSLLSKFVMPGLRPTGVRHDFCLRKCTTLILLGFRWLRII